MNFKQKLGYTAFGAAIMLIGVLAANHLTPIAAQNNGVFDEITCKRLVVSNNWKMNVVLAGTENGGYISVLDKDENDRIQLSIQQRESDSSILQPSLVFTGGNGEIRMNNSSNDKVAIRLATSENPSTSNLLLRDNTGKNTAALWSVSQGPALMLYGPQQSFTEDIQNPFVRLRATKSGGLLTLSHGTDTPLGAFLIDESGKSILICDKVLD